MCYGFFRSACACNLALDVPVSKWNYHEDSFSDSSMSFEPVGRPVVSAEVTQPEVISVQHQSV